MATKKPRVQVTLTTAQHELLLRLAKLQGRSMSSVIAELFEQVHPVLERVAVVLQAAVRAQESMKQGLRESTEQAERDLRPHLAAAMGQLDLLEAQFDVAGTDGRERAQRATSRRDPRPVTRGSGGTQRPPGGQRRRTNGRGVESLGAAIASAVRRGPVRKARRAK